MRGTLCHQFQPFSYQRLIALLAEWLVVWLIEILESASVKTALSACLQLELLCKRVFVTGKGFTLEFRGRDLHPHQSDSSSLKVLHVS